MHTKVTFQELKGLLEGRMQSLDQCPEWFEEDFQRVSNRLVVGMTALVNLALDKLAKEPLWCLNSHTNALEMYSGLFKGFDGRVSKFGLPPNFSINWISESVVRRILIAITDGRSGLVTGKARLLVTFIEIGNLQEVLDRPFPQPQAEICYDEAHRIFNERIRDLVRHQMRSFKVFCLSNKIPYRDLNWDEV